MPCYFPLQASFVIKSDGKKEITFDAVNQKRFAEGLPLRIWDDSDGNLSIPCGRCMGCRLENSRQWAVRCLHESKMYEDNCFITLTYNEENVPKDGSLVKKHIQDFMKRLKVKFDDRTIRQFYCGEYGDKLSRPHYHVCLFNFDFKDRKRFKKINDYWYYTSEILDKVWGKGYCLVCDFSFETAAYVARYCTKKINGEMALEHYNGKTPEFAEQSRRPGLGEPWLQKYGKSDVFPHDNCVVNGKECKTPRYYDVLREREDPGGFAEAKDRRRINAEKRAFDGTSDRLAVRLKCLEARLKKVTRMMER